ncbi:WhiB family transcriptional regulator [Rhodococcus sp. P1Y]|uniref:WhiB family transcriptional regulator n=1 Tax=Rhodococcus sp. P1Y TaxID=1302308 RepID=UPI000EAEBBAD|nr:WhiB family transcriptional regulator [Rhodococcus sp. P1Y]AYJ48875.1 WhiB family transcriptional regulator [Rhodococcus sp. P1Y]
MVDRSPRNPILPGGRLDQWEWQLRAQCRSMPVSIFYPPHGLRGHSLTRYEAAAKLVCVPCPVRAACLGHAVAVHEPYGIWGGLTARERNVGDGRDRFVPVAR